MRREIPIYIFVRTLCLERDPWEYEVEISRANCRAETNEFSKSQRNPTWRWREEWFGNRRACLWVRNMKTQCWLRLAGFIGIISLGCIALSKLKKRTEAVMIWHIGWLRSSKPSQVYPLCFSDIVDQQASEMLERIYIRCPYRFHTWYESAIILDAWEYTCLHENWLKPHRHKIITAIYILVGAKQVV